MICDRCKKPMTYHGSPHDPYYFYKCHPCNRIYWFGPDGELDPDGELE